MESNSRRFSLNSIDWQKVRTGFKVALAGAAVTYLVPELTGIEWVFYVNGHLIDLTPVAGMVFSVLANILRKYASDYSRPEFDSAEPLI